MDFNLVGEYLNDVGCCRTCVLRFLKPNIDDFLDVDYALRKFVSLINLFQFKIRLNGIFRQKNLEISDDVKSEVKRRKPNTCVSCFGLFEFIDEVVMKVKASESLAKYEVKRFLTSYSLPVSLDLAQLQIWLALIEKFPEAFGSGETEIENLKTFSNLHRQIGRRTCPSRTSSRTFSTPNCRTTCTKNSIPTDS